MEDFSNGFLIHSFLAWDVSKTIMELPFFIGDGSFYVWLEFICSPMHYNTEDSSYWISSICCFLIPLALSTIMSLFKFVRPTSFIQKYLPWMQKVLKVPMHMLDEAHLISGILASFSHLGQFDSDNDHILASSQAKWKHVLMFPLLVLLCFERIKDVTKPVQSAVALIGIILALCPLQHREKISYGNTPTSAADKTFMVLCPLAVSLASPCTFTIKPQSFFRVENYKRWKHVLKKFVKGSVALAVFLAFQGKQWGPISLVKYASTLPLIIGSSLFLINKPKHASPLYSSKHFDVGLHFIVLLAAMLLSSSSLMGRIIVTLLLAIWKKLLK